MISKKALCLTCICSGIIYVLSPINSVNAEVLEAKTPLTVVNLTYFYNEPKQSPIEVLKYKETVELSDVVYGVGHISWKKDPKCSWNAVETGASTRIWKIYTDDEGRTYSAIGWDYLYPCAESHERGNNVPIGTRGTMLSSLCDTNPARCNGRERTNIMFWP